MEASQNVTSQTETSTRSSPGLVEPSTSFTPNETPETPVKQRLFVEAAIGVMGRKEAVTQCKCIY